MKGKNQLVINDTGGFLRLKKMERVILDYLAFALQQEKKKKKKSGKLR